MNTRVRRPSASEPARTELGGDDTGLLRISLDATEESLLVVNTLGKILMTNEIGAKRLGETPATLSGMALQEISPAVLPSIVLSHRLEMLKHVEQTGAPVRFTDSRCGRFYDNHLRPLHNHRGEVTAVTIYAADVTELVQNRNEQATCRQALAQAKRMALMSVAHRSLIHQLAQPLTGLMLSLENGLVNLGRDPSGPLATARLTDAVTQMRRTVTLLEKWRRRSHTPANTDPLKTDVHRGVEETVETLRSVVWRHRVRICLNDLDKLPHAQIGAEQLALILHALIESILSTAEGSGNRTLEITGVREENHVGLELSADFATVPPQPNDLSQLFFGAKTGHGSMDQELAVVQHLVSEAGGTISLERKCGGGTVFLVRLPIAK